MTARISLILALSIVIFAATAQVSKATAATAATACGHQAAYSHKGQALRSLSSVKSTKLHRFCTKFVELRTKAKTIKHQRLLVAPRYKYCWKVPDKKWRASVCRARAKLRRILTKDLPWLDQRIKALLPQPRFPKWLLDAFICIHNHEGAWNSKTGNGYDGGLQMDATFQVQYGPEFVHRWGSADKWPIWAQMTAAIRAYTGWVGPDPRTRTARGFGPWPNTAHSCRLI